MQVCGMTVKNYLSENCLDTAMVLRFGNRRMLDGSITIEGEQCHFMLNLFVVGIDAVTHDSRDGTLVSCSCPWSRSDHFLQSVTSELFLKHARINKSLK